MDNNFKDKTVIITGGSQGVGAATARRFADAGGRCPYVDPEKPLKRINSGCKVRFKLLNIK